MPIPITLTSPSYQIFQIKMSGAVLESNGTAKIVSNLFDYYLSTSGVVTSSNVATAKTSLATAFTSQCWTGVLAAALNNQYVPQALQVKALDVKVDPFLACNTPTQASGSAAARQSTHNTVIVRKLTGMGSRSWTSGRWAFSPLNISDESSDEEYSTGLANWVACKTPLSSSLSVTINSVGYSFVPILISAIQSEMVQAPLVFTFAALTGCSVDKRISTLRRRNQKTLISEPPYA
jgi:hypothetical protein